MKEVFVVFGSYSDGTGTKLFAVYENGGDAERHVQVAKESASVYTLTYAKVPVNRPFPVELRT